MAKTLDQLIAESDELISQKTAARQEKVASVEDDDIFKMAETLRSAPEPVPETHSDIETLTEKVAHAVAITDTLLNLPLLVKIGEFEKTASDKGYSEDQIRAYVEKLAEGKMKSIAKMLPWLGAAAATGAVGAASHHAGRKKGRREGVNAGARYGYAVGRRHAGSGQ